MALDTFSVEARIPVEAQGDDVWNALDRVGLELWQSPEGFWAIRLKPATPASQSKRRPARRSR